MHTQNFRKFMDFLDMWPGLVTAFENVLADRQGKAKTKAKIKGSLETLPLYRLFCKFASYLDVLDPAGPSSLVCKAEGVMLHEIAEWGRSKGNDRYIT